MTSANNTKTIKKATVKNGDYAGLEMRFIESDQLEGLKAAQIVHPTIAGLEVRALVASCMTFSELFREFRANVKVMI